MSSYQDLRCPSARYSGSGWIAGTGAGLSLGRAVIVDRLAEVVFMQVVRHCVKDTGQPVGFLTAYTHPALSRAMKGFHESPEQRWTLADAADRAHMSRAGFARTFKAVSGWTWQHYQTWWRMQLAWSALSAGESVITVAESIGYQSEAAFSRAFRKHFGVYAGAVGAAARLTTPNSS